MPRTASQANEPYVSDYDANTGEFVLTARYNIAGATSLVTEAGLGHAEGATPPPYIALPVTLKDADAVTVSQTIICWFGTERLTSISPDVGTLVSEATYHGRIQGILSVTPQIQMVSEPLILDLNSTVTSKLGIGTNLEGAPRQLPLLIYEVVECLDLDALDDRMMSVVNIAGKVNEDNWADAPWNVGGVKTEEKGAFLYCGVGAAISDRRTRTVLLTHIFTKRLDWADQSTYVWYKAARSLDANNVPVLTGVGTAQSSQIYYVAGSSGEPDNGDDVCDAFNTLWLDLDSVRPLYYGN